MWDVLHRRNRPRAPSTRPRSTIFHPGGTAKMGPESDPMAMVDQYCRVRGVAGLRVVDASVMPNIVRANTSVTCMMIGARVAEWMRT
jgi:choline dehydrogenase